MKRLVIICLVCLLVFAVCSCGGSAPMSGEAAAPEESQEVKINEVDTDEFYFVVNGVLQDISGNVVGFTTYMENKTDRTLMFSWTNTSVNGYMVDNWLAEEVAPGKKANADAYFVSADMEDNGIESVDKAEYTLWVYDAENWGEDDVYKETFTIEKDS